MPAFTLGGIPGNVERPDAAQAQAQAVETAARSLETALRTIVTAFTTMGEGRLPTDDDAHELDGSNRALYQSLGLTDEDYERKLAETRAQEPPQEPLTEEAAAAVLAALREAAKEAAANLAAMDEEDRQAAEQRKRTTE